MGAAARFGEGDTQWLTAGGGIQHAEMFPMVHPDRPNTLEMFQIWLNLPAADKMVPAYFTMLWGEQTPRLHHLDTDGRSTDLTVVAGSYPGVGAQDSPPNSWASRPESAIGIWHLSMAPDAHFELPGATDDGINRVLYAFEGSWVDIDGTPVKSGNGAVLNASAHLSLQAGAEGIEVMVLQGRPIGEPVVQYGPFVMNTEQEIQETFRDYQATQFGGWPWPKPDPDHGGAGQGRFARHADGGIVEPGSA
jgi:redox-sensitive bicupin YhaK (pirin superfamily)